MAARSPCSGQRIEGLSSRRIAALGVARTFQHVLLRPTACRCWRTRHLGGASPRAPRHPGGGHPAGPGGRGQPAAGGAGPARPRRHRPLGHASGRQPRAWASNGCWRSPAPWRPTRRCCCWTNRPPGCGTRRSRPCRRCSPTLRGQGLSILLVEHDMGFRHGPGGPDRGDGFRREDRRRSARGDPPRPSGAGRLFGRRAVTPLLDVRGLGVSYGKAEAVRQVDLAVAPGQIVAVIGPNGAGKSTLLLALMGALPARGRHQVRRSRVRRRRDGEPGGGRAGAGAGKPGAVRFHVGAGQPAPGRLRPAARLQGRRGRRRWMPSTRGSRVCRNGRASWRRRCRAASGRCWRWAAPCSAVPAC